jgi:membrane protein DedA with SNARE-associated domain
LIALNRDRVGDFASLGYAGAFLAMLASNATLILPAPGLVIVFALGNSLNPILVGLCGASGAALGELTGYVTGLSGVVVMENTRAASRIKYWMERNGALTIFVLSIFPNPFFDIAGLMAGAGKMPVWKFLLTAFLGKTIQAITIALAGALSLSWVEHWLFH